MKDPVVQSVIRKLEERQSLEAYRQAKSALNEAKARLEQAEAEIKRRLTTQKRTNCQPIIDSSKDSL